MTIDLRQRLQTLVATLPESSLPQAETLLNTLAPSVTHIAQFEQLATQWRQETRGISSSNAITMHPAYQQIIGMGKAVIPLLLKELEIKSGRWYWALKAITGEDPVLPEHHGHTQKMTDAWLQWGRDRGYQW
jgi:hypothetical protein